MPVELTTIPRTYAELLRAVQRVLFTGQRGIETAGFPILRRNAKFN
jgi:hypothetical protein